jgi:hypothetical protein
MGKAKDILPDDGTASAEERRLKADVNLARGSNEKKFSAKKLVCRRYHFR